MVALKGGEIKRIGANASLYNLPPSPLMIGAYRTPSPFPLSRGRGIRFSKDLVDEV